MRNFPNWLEAYVDCASFTESPLHMHYWVGVSAIAAVLGRRVWLDQKAFKWFPNFYLLLVGPPNVVKKTTTLNQATKLLRRLDGFAFGPDIVTWQALITDFKNAEREEDIGNGEIELQSNLYCATGEMGSFLDPSDRRCMDILVKLWDGERIDKKTKTSTNEEIAMPMLNIGGCCTPSWMRLNIPPYMVDGGLFSRFVTLYGDKRSKRVFLPALMARPDYEDFEDKLVEDLDEIRKFRGHVMLEHETVEIIEQQYDRICDAEEGDDSEKVLARKQVQIFKLAMIIAAAVDSGYKGHLVLTGEILLEAERRIDSIEDQRLTVIRFIGNNRQVFVVEKIISILKKRNQITIGELYSHIFQECPNKDEFQALIKSAAEARHLKILRVGYDTVIALGPEAL